MKYFLISLFALFTCKLHSQIAISYYPIQSILSLSSNTERLVWADYKVETNTFILNLNMEVSPKINVKRTTLANYYVGPGFGFNATNAVQDLPLINGYFIDIGTRIKPISKCRNVQIVFEISPYINYELGGGNLRTRLGIAYNFNRKNTTAEEQKNQ